MNHLLFVDDMFLLFFISEKEGRYIHWIINNFCQSTRMKVNVEKFGVFCPDTFLTRRNCWDCFLLFPIYIHIYILEEGLKYLGFYLNPNSYIKSQIELIDIQDRKKNKLLVQ